MATQIQSQDIANGAVGTTQIANGAVTSPLLNISSGDSVLTADVSASPSSVYIDTGLNITLPAAGTYFICACIATQLNASNASSMYMESKLYNATDAADVPNTNFVCGFLNPNVANVTYQFTSSFNCIITVAASKVIKVYTKRDGGATWVSSTVGGSLPVGNSRLDFVRLA